MTDLSQLPKISIITPSYNQGQFIEETIASVIGEGYPNLEYIIIDGGSKDESVDIIRKYEKDITYWVSEKDKGQTDAINKGLKRATGEIVAWLNSDDVYESGTLQKIADAYLENPDAEVFLGDVLSFFPDGRTEVWVNKFDAEDLMNRVSIHQPGVFWKRALHERYGYLDESFYYLMDYDLWMRLLFNCRIEKIDSVLTRFRVHDEAKTGRNPIGLYDDYRRVISRFANSLPQTDMKDMMVQLGIYANTEDAKYRLERNFTTEELNIFLDNYIHNCIIQEYTRRNVVKTNQLILKTLKRHKLSAKLKTFVKNNLGISYLKKR